MKLTESALADLPGKELSGLDLVALMVDGVYFADQLCAGGAWTPPCRSSRYWTAPRHLPRP